MDVALDIETTGLSLADTLTCIAIAGRDHCWTWCTGPGYNHEETKEAVEYQLNTAARILTYNGAAFDIPFLQKHFAWSDETVGSYMAKLIDPLYAARALLGYEACPKLSEVLLLNGIQPKTASGAEAIVMAREGRWEELADYCANDTRITYELLARAEVYWTQNLVFRNSSVAIWSSSGFRYET